MPLFEYRCLDCDKTFEEIVLGGARPQCPSCESENLRKLLSAFAVGSGSTIRSSGETPTGGCGSCGDPRGPGSCVN
jgi:putative FmdB family regulatory protein